MKWFDCVGALVVFCPEFVNVLQLARGWRKPTWTNLAVFPRISSMWSNRKFSSLTWTQEANASNNKQNGFLNLTWSIWKFTENETWQIVREDLSNVFITGKVTRLEYMKISEQKLLEYKNTEISKEFTYYRKIALLATKSNVSGPVHNQVLTNFSCSFWNYRMMLVEEEIRTKTES